MKIQIQLLIILALLVFAAGIYCGKAYRQQYTSSGEKVASVDCITLDVDMAHHNGWCLPVGV